jgi:hypothetical protein
MQQNLGEAVPVKKRIKSDYNQRNLGTIKEREKETQEKEVSSGEAMRILRMRCVAVPPIKIFFRSFKCRRPNTRIHWAAA